MRQFIFCGGIFLKAVVMILLCISIRFCFVLWITLSSKIPILQVKYLSMTAYDLDFKRTF